MPIEIAEIPPIIKYMGSKKPIIDFITSNIQSIHKPGKPVCDLFAGSCSVSAALRKQFDFISNDIQEYSSILAHTYFSDLSSCDFEEIKLKIDTIAFEHLSYFKANYPELFFDYQKIRTLKDYQRIELKQRKLTTTNFETDFHLFVKNYSGTYWSFEQCVWFDALRKSAEAFKGEKVYYAMISSIMFAMSYSTQSTGHFAQYRDGNTLDAMHNILTYRIKSVYDLFSKKLNELVSSLDNHLKKITTTTSSFTESLQNLPRGCTVYADPPYAPVHYSRFYHVLETLVRYDYPTIEHKGRYRDDRHQSPFSQKSKAEDAFGTMFRLLASKKHQMLLSYSGTGVVPIDKIVRLARQYFGSPYTIDVKEISHQHSTMGRFEDHTRDVTEYLIIAKLPLK